MDYILINEFHLLEFKKQGLTLVYLATFNVPTLLKLNLCLLTKLRIEI